MIVYNTWRARSAHLEVRCESQEEENLAKGDADSDGDVYNINKEGNTECSSIREVLGAHKQLGAHSSLNGGARLGT